MNSAINPMSAPSQTSVTGNQVNKSMHPQGTTASYSQPSHMSQSLGNMHTNTNVAHSQSNQQHHYSLNAPNAAGHYVNQNMGQIPASNHPVANASSTAAGQGYNLQKNVTNYMSNYQANLAQQPNQNTIPPVSQAIPASIPSLPNASTDNTTPEHPEQQQPGKPQSNGTAPVKSPQKSENTSNLPLASKGKNVQPAPVPQLPHTEEKPQEKVAPLSAPVPTQEPQIKSTEPTDSTETKSVLPLNNSKPPPTSCSDTQQPKTFVENATFNVASHVENDEKSTAIAPTETIAKELGEKKVDEKPASSAQLENDETSKSFESNNDNKSGDNKPSEPPVIIENKETAKSPLKTSPKEDVSSAKQTFSTTVTTTPTRKAKAQTPKSDESLKTPKEPKTSVQKSPSLSKTKRQRIRTQPYQSPLPEVELISKITLLTPRTPKTNDEKLIVFYKNEFLAVRNAEGSFYLCQAVQNIYKTSVKIKIRWLSQDKNDKTGEIYTPDFYDLTDFDCILTNLSLNRIDKGKYKLPESEKERTQSILNRSLAVEKGEVSSPSLTEEHPDGLDLSLYRDEDQLKKRKAKKRKSGRKPSDSSTEKKIPTKKTPDAPKVRKVASSTTVPAKNVSKKKTVQPLKKSFTSPETKKSATSSNRALGRGKSKTNTKTSSVVEQKKAKVSVKTGKKNISPAAKPVQSSTKNVKSGNKTAAVSKKAAQTKKSVIASVKPPPRNARRSTRK